MWKVIRWIGCGIVLLSGIVAAVGLLPFNFVLSGLGSGLLTYDSLQDKEYPYVGLHSAFVVLMGISYINYI